MRVSEFAQPPVTSLFACQGANKAVISQYLCAGKCRSHFRRLDRVKANSVDSDVTVRGRLERRDAHNTLTARPSSQITKPFTTLCKRARIRLCSLSLLSLFSSPNDTPERKPRPCRRLTTTPTCATTPWPTLPCNPVYQTPSCKTPTCKTRRPRKQRLSPEHDLSQ
jgi:hypothetical protein